MNPTTYTRDAGLILARLAAEGISMRRAVRLIPRESGQISRWAHLPEDPHFRRLLALAESAAAGDAECERALYSPPASRAELLDSLLARMPADAESLARWVARRRVR